MDVNIEYNKLLSLYAGNSLISSLIREDFVDAAMLNDRAGSVKKFGPNQFPFPPVCKHENEKRTLRSCNFKIFVSLVFQLIGPARVHIRFPRCQLGCVSEGVLIICVDQYFIMAPQFTPLFQFNHISN